MAQDPRWTDDSAREVRELIAFRDKAMHDEATRMAQAVREARKESTLEIARNMLVHGIDRDKVLEWTGLGPEDLA